jgi:hypothetical protein
MHREVKLGALRINFWTGWRSPLNFGVESWVGSSYLQLTVLLPFSNITLTLSLNND